MGSKSFTSIFRRRMAILSIALSGVFGLQAQTVTDNSGTNYAANTLEIGTLQNATSLTLTGTWNESLLLNLQKAIKSSWSNDNIVVNSKLISVDMNTVSLTGTFADSGFKYLFRSCNTLKTIILPQNGSSEFVSLEYTFTDCKALTTLTNLDKFSNITDLSSAFQNCRKMTSITFSQAINENPVSLNRIFNACNTITTINNLDKFTNITSLDRAFLNCNVLAEVRLGTDPNQITSIARTFEGITVPCIKYLPTGVTTIPSSWITSEFNNFVLPLTVAQNLVAPAAIDADNALSLPDTPAVTPTYAIIKDTMWQISKTGTFTDTETYLPNTLLNKNYNGALLRYTAIDYNNIEYYSNTVLLTVNSPEVEIVEEIVTQDKTLTPGNNYHPDSEIKIIPGVTLTLTNNKNYTLPNIRVEVDANGNAAQIYGAHAQIENISSLTIEKTMTPQQWTTLQLPFAILSAAQIKALDTNGDEISVAFTNNLTDLNKNNYYTSIQYDGAARAKNGALTADPKKQKYWRFCEPGNPLGFGTLIAASDNIAKLIFTSADSEQAKTAIASPAREVDLNYAFGTTGVTPEWQQVHFGWNLTGAVSTTNTPITLPGEDKIIQVYSPENNNFTPRTQVTHAGVFEPFFVRTTEENQKISFAQPNMVRSLNDRPTLYALELCTATGTFLDRLYIAQGNIDERNVPKIGAMGNSSVLLSVRRNGMDYCVANEEAVDGISQFNLYVDTKGRNDLQLICTTSGYDKLTLNNNPLIYNTPVAITSGTYNLYLGEKKTSNASLDKNDTIRVYTMQNQLVIEGAKAGKSYRINTINGIEFASGITTEGQTTLTLPQGFYLINVNGVASKVNITF